MIKDLRTDYRPISDYTMACIAEYMDDEIREQLHFELAPCSNEWFIAEYARRLSISESSVFEDILTYVFNLNLDDIVYKAYRDRYGNKLISYARLIWLETACPFVISVEDLGETWKYKDARVYAISMISGDFIVYAREEVKQ